jgi:hypothetical protein
MSDTTLDGERTKEHPGPQRLHETSDVSVRGVLWFGAGVVGFVVAVVAVLAWFFWMQYAREARVKTTDLPLAKERRRQGPILPPPPRLEQIERRRGVPPERKSDLIDPDGYGWVDREAGVARIPLAEAEERARASGLLRSTGKASSSVPSDANSGRQPWRGK